MFSEPTLAISQAADIAALCACTSDITARWGFSTFSVTAVSTEVSGATLFKSVYNHQPDYIDIFTDPEGAKRDPVMQFIRRTAVPIIWDQNTYHAAGQYDLFEQQSPFGLRHGIAVCVHLPGSRHVAVGFDGPDAFPISWAARTEMLAQFQLCSAFFADAAERLMFPSPAGADLLQLTPREREALHWTSEGKTAYEIGRILSISEGMVNRVISTLQAKLNCVSKAQTVAKAIRLGIIN
ncbi:autoinducer binding domain-containing protein [Ottowia sp.]|uniref:helix-turn-helix transcriptional regulator n=1 Tax=Ottowia sp. TaxID=1898956 RepID=UPI0025DA6234|nr:autoinducer binding domain-containing protein [Ottowia sp.]MBK6616114.1 autoinducer binding domain-containing protein [Ottowia sp.]